MLYQSFLFSYKLVSAFNCLYDTYNLPQFLYFQFWVLTFNCISTCMRSFIQIEDEGVVCRIKSLCQISRRFSTVPKSIYCSKFKLYIHYTCRCTITAMGVGVGLWKIQKNTEIFKTVYLFLFIVNVVASRKIFKNNVMQLYLYLIVYAYIVFCIYIFYWQLL